MSATDDMARDAALLEDVVADLADVVATKPALDLDNAITVWDRIEQVRKTLAGICADFADLIARSLPDNRVIDAEGNRRGTLRYTGHGLTVERRRAAKRTTWDADALLSAVMDARLVDTKTGEVTEQTPLEKVTFVWNLGTPRVSALHALGLDPDAFCATEWPDRYSLRTYQ